MARPPGATIRSLPFRRNDRPALGFEIFRLSQLFERAAQRRLDHELDTPQRPEFHTIYVGLRGKGQLIVDFTPVPLGAHHLTFVARGRVQQFVPDRAVDAWMLLFAPEFLLAGDIVYRGVHAWTRETNAAQRKAWRKTLDELAALKPDTVIAGHKDPKLKDDAGAIDATRTYLETFDAAVASSKTSAEVQQKVKAKYPEAQLDIILQLGADAAFGGDAAH